MFQALRSWLFPPRDLEEFWQKHPDRRHMRGHVYPALGEWLRQFPQPRLLDVGCQWHGVRNKQWLNNPDVEFWVVDPSRAPAGLQCDRFLRVAMQDLPQRYPETRLSFQAVISYGVLGYYRFDQATVASYLEAVAQVLKPDGLFLLKLDLTRLESYEPAYQVHPHTLDLHFVETSAAGLDARTEVSDEQHRYRFLTLRKR